MRSTAMRFVRSTDSVARTTRRTSSSSSGVTTSSSRISPSLSSARSIVWWLLLSAPIGVFSSWAMPATRVPSVASRAWVISRAVASPPTGTLTGRRGSSVRAVP